MSTCETGNDYDGRIGVRISAIFVILFGSAFGAWFPVYAVRHRGLRVPEWVFFIAKFFGSGVIIATAFIHLLAPAADALTDPCLTGPITEYDWAEGICLIAIFIIFFVELMTMRYAKFGRGVDGDLEDQTVSNTQKEGAIPLDSTARKSGSGSSPRRGSHMPGHDHLGHARDHEEVSPDWVDAQQAADQPIKGRANINPESYSAQLTAVFILEFGVIFHSVFIGLTLAVSGSEFNTLYVVLIFHQTFEGLGLGSRLAGVAWPEDKKWTPYFLGIGYAISTPLATAIGLGVRQSYPPNSQTTLITNGIFDSISAGILIYTGLVELMAHEFMFSGYMQRAPIKVVLSAFGTMCLGAGLMALLGKWA